jgi:nucleotide-binding universal stress UspA family protein
MATIVVGTDGSPNSRAALKWAHAYARRNGATLLVVHAWYYPYAASETGAMAAPGVAEFEAAAAELLEHEADALESHGVVIARSLRQGAAAHVLLDESKSADALVVGARGHGGFMGLLLGSVASQCVRHAKVPTIVVPATASDEPTQG